jgi:myo-inositol-1(or 4)-monophosphatase
MNPQRVDFIKNLALEAGGLTLEGYGKCSQLPKALHDGYDIATEYDLRTEALIKSRILDEFDEPILGEEDGLTGDREVARQRLWIVDPIDGTFNYQRGVPLYGVSIAYCEAGIPVFGAIFLPVVGQLFYASQGQGAFLEQGEPRSVLPISTNREQDVSKLIIDMAGQGVYRLFAACDVEGIPRRSLRHFMCAVVSLAYIAAGRMDAYVHSSLNLWDCAAGDILVREAGGPATCDYQGKPIFPEYVNRLLERNDHSPFPFVAVSSRAVFKEPVRRIIASARLKAGE